MNRDKPNKTGYRGVDYRKGRRKPYRAKIKIYDEHRHIGYFETALEAALAYDSAAIAAWGEFARLNFPDTDRALRVEDRSGPGGFGIPF